LGTSSREDEVGVPHPLKFPWPDFFNQPWAFESRDFLRALAVGKEISFVSTHSLPPNDDVARDFGTAEIGGLDVGSELLRNGWAKIKEIKRDPTEEDLKKRDLEAEAKGAGKGLWNPHGPKVCVMFARTNSEAQKLIT
jgi:staphylococcal nuclease domain-containing protein 1